MGVKRRMQGLVQLALLAISVVLSGCVCLSIHPLYSGNDTTFEPALLGTWALKSDVAEAANGGESPATFKFADAGEGTYTLTHTVADGASSSFQVHLVRIGEALFLDLYPDRSDEELGATWLYTFQLLGMHQFLYVEQLEPELVVREMNYDWLADQLAADPALLKNEAVYVDEGDEPFYILTAQPAELQQFYAANIDTEGAYFDERDKRTYVKIAQAETPAEPEDG